MVQFQKNLSQMGLNLKKSSFWKQHGLAIGTGLVYGLATRILFSLKISYSPWNDVFGVMSYAFLFFMPLVVGAVTIVLASPESQRSWPYRIFMPMVSCLLMMLAAFVLAWEGIICLVFAGPIVLVLGSLGGCLAGLIMTRWGTGAKRGYVLASFALLPFLAAPLESRLPEAPSFRIVRTQIAIAADSEIVWGQIVRVPEIQETERPTSFYHRIGIPKPLEATLSHEGPGGIREARFEKGIVFYETVTEWEPGRALGFDIHIDPMTIPPDALDEHVRVGDRYFDVLHGRFEIEPRPEGGVILHLSSRHRLTTPFNWYSSFWSDRVMQDIQETICQVVKGRSEH